MFIYVFIQFQITTISRSREVKQSWASTAVSFIRSTFESIRIIGFYHPDLVKSSATFSFYHFLFTLFFLLNLGVLNLQILCNGPGTCVPICLVAFIFKVNLEKKRTENLNYLCKLFKILGIVVKKHNNCIRGKHLSSSFPLAYWENYGYTFGWPVTCPMAWVKPKIPSNSLYW